MSDTTASSHPHLLIPGAGLPPADDATPRKGLVLQNLQALLAGMAPQHTIETSDEGLSMPWELALARLHGLPGEAGHIPFAAFETRTVGTPCAWVLPCHWQVGRDHVLLGDPADLALAEADSRALLAAAAPYFAEDGITLAWHAPDRWLATGEIFRTLPTLSLERVIGQRITPAVFETSARHSPVLRRLQNEMQMLFYTHAANDARQEQGLPAVNSFWVLGAGVLEAPVAPRPGIMREARLRTAALHRDAAAHAAAWQALDADVGAAWLARQRAGEAVHLTLCGERRAITFAPAAPTFTQRLARLFGARGDTRILEQL